MLPRNFGNERVQLGSKLGLQLTLRVGKIGLRLLRHTLHFCLAFRSRSGCLLLQFLLLRGEIAGHFLRERLEPLIGGSPFGRLGREPLKAERDDARGRGFVDLANHRYQG